MLGSRKLIAVVIACAGIGAASVAGTAAGDPTPSASQFAAAGNGPWEIFGTARWTGDGLLTDSAPAPSEPFGVTSGGALLRGAALPANDPRQIVALSFDFKAAQSGDGGGSARMVVCFSDGPSCDSYAELGPSRWVAGQLTHVDGFAPSDGVNNIWTNGGRGGTCPYTSNTTWSAIVACHPGALITEIKVVNDSGYLYPNGEQVILNNFTANHVTAGASPPVLAESATVVPVKGRVLVRRPGGKGFVRARSPISLGFGGEINAENGRVKLIAAKRQGRQRGVFRGGTFKLRQNGRGRVQATLAGELVGCKDNLAVVSARRKKRRLWGRASGGRFRTSGNYGAATVRGTVWLTEDRCSGTFFKVKKGTIEVFDAVRGKTIVLEAGESYLVRRPKGKKKN